MTALNISFSYLNRCTHCKHISDGLQICSQCKFETYCSVECQKHDWKRHRKECVKSVNEEIVVGRNVIKNIINQSSFLEFAARLCKEWAYEKKYSLTAIILKSENSSLPNNLKAINGTLPSIYDVTFNRQAIDNDHFDEGELRVILIYLSNITKKYEFISNLYIDKSHVNKLLSANHMNNQPGFIKTKNFDLKNNIEKGLIIQVVL